MFEAFYAELRSLADKCTFYYCPAVGGGVLPVDEMLGAELYIFKKRVISQGSTSYWKRSLGFAGVMKLRQLLCGL